MLVWALILRVLISYCNGNDIVVQAYFTLAHGEVVTDRLCGKIDLPIIEQRLAVYAGFATGSKANCHSGKIDKLSSMEEDLQSLSWKLKQNDVEMLDKANTPKGQQDGRPSWGCAK